MPPLYRLTDCCANDRFVVLCPEGSEGTTYALLTTVTNLGGTVVSIRPSLLSLSVCSLSD